jgi:hypothetical protein
MVRNNVTIHVAVCGHLCMWNVPAFSVVKYYEVRCCRCGNFVTCQLHRKEGTWAKHSEDLQGRLK